MASWAHSGEELVFVVAAIGTQGKYDIDTINRDGSGCHNITPDYFPADFLCNSPIFSLEDSRIFFVGEWWE